MKINHCVKILCVAALAAISHRSSAAIVEADGRDFESGKQLISITGGLKANQSTHALGIQFSSAMSLIPTAFSVGGNGTLTPGMSMTTQSSGSKITVSAPNSNWAVQATVTDCYADTMSWIAQATLSYAGAPSGYDACNSGMTFCDYYAAIVTSGSSCPTSSGSYTLDNSGTFGPGERLCVFMSYAAYNGDATELLYSTQQEAGDTPKAYCDCDSGGTCTHS